MARIRTIKPGFFRDEDLFELEQESGLPCRVAYAGLWTVADREGRFKWEPRKIKLDCLPYDDVDFSRVLDALASRGFVVKYAVDGREYGVIPTFTAHQIINNRETPSELPEPPKNGGNQGHLTRGGRVDDATGTPLNPAQAEQEQEQELSNPQTPLPSEPTRQEGSMDEIDQIRIAVWRQSGLSEDAISTKRVSTSQEGVRQARGWLEKFSLAEALEIITEAYDGAESRGDAIRKPWVYLDRVFATKAEERDNPPQPAAPKADPWEGRRNLLEMGIWLDNYGARPGNVACDAPKWAQELFLANKHKREGRAA